MFIMNQFFKSLIGIIAYKSASMAYEGITELTGSFTEALNLYRCKDCYRLWKDLPEECRCGSLKLDRLERQKEKGYHEFTKTKRALRRRQNQYY